MHFWNQGTVSPEQMQRNNNCLVNAMVLLAHWTQIFVCNCFYNTLAAVWDCLHVTSPCTGDCRKHWNHCSTHARPLDGGVILGWSKTCIGRYLHGNSLQANVSLFFVGIFKPLHFETCFYIVPFSRTAKAQLGNGQPKHCFVFAWNVVV